MEASIDELVGMANRSRVVFGSVWGLYQLLVHSWVLSHIGLVTNKGLSMCRMAY